MIILGIDPGLATTGYGIIEYTQSRTRLVTYGCLSTSKHTIFAERLVELREQLKNILADHHPDRAGVEELFFAKNVKTAIQVGHARGVILLTLHEAKIPIIELTPLQVKQATAGYGQADKTQIQKMVQMQLGLKTIPKPDDAADALAIALTAIQAQSSRAQSLTTKNGMY